MKLSRLLPSAFIGTFLVLTVSGCSTTPAALHAQALSPEIRSQLSSTQPIVAYFSRTQPTTENCECDSGLDPAYSSVPVANGYYRALLGRNSKGHFLVQDFYQKTKSPQSSPIWIIDPVKIFSFQSTDVEGPATLYYENGKIASRFNNVAGETILSEIYYPNGQIGSSYKLKNNKHSTNQLWYSNGQKAATYDMDSNNEMTGFKAWDENNQATEDVYPIIEKIFDELEKNASF